MLLLVRAKVRVAAAADARAVDEEMRTRDTSWEAIEQATPAVAVPAPGGADTQ